MKLRYCYVYKNYIKLNTWQNSNGSSALLHWIQALPICICFVYDQRCICFVYVQRFTTNTKNDQSVLIKKKKKKRMINQYFVYKIVVLFIFRNFTYILVIWLLHFNLHILLSNICHTQRQRQQRLLTNYLDKIDHRLRGSSTTIPQQTFT